MAQAPAETRWLSRTASLLSAAVLCSTAGPARAGNDDAILIGGHAAMTGGAVSATIGDGSASWYNPAGLARSTRQTLDLNASVYGISLSSSQGLFTLPDGTHGDATVLDWQLVPSALSYVRQLSPRLVGAFSIVIPYSTDSDLRSSISEANGREWLFEVDSLRNEYDYIVSLGVRVNDRLRVGVSLAGIYISSETMSQVGVGQPDTPDTAFAVISQHTLVGDYGLRLTAGVQWSPARNWDLGLSAQLPALTGFRREVDAGLSGVAGGDGTQTSSVGITNQSSLRGVWELSTPLSLRMGVAYSFGGVQLALDGSLSTPLNSQERELDRALSGNARAGILVKRSELLSFGVGVFSDLNGQRAAGTDFVGVAGGVRLSHSYRVVEGQRDLTFFTTLAGRYAFGWGKTEGISLTSEETPELSSSLASLQTHELAFNLGGGVNF
ncbi:MAG TPA: hypothetical protein VFZ61_10810 [Polyangiales bacterium]